MKRISFLVAALFAGQTWATDLLSLYREAQLQDSTYAGAKAQYIGTQEKMPQARALLLPSVSFGAGTHYNEVNTDYPNNPSIVSGRTEFYDYNYGINVTQPLYRRQNMATFEQAKVQVKQADTQLAVASQELIGRVAQGYFDVLLARANLATILSQKTAVAEQLEQAKRNFIVGTATITDSREAQARYDLVVAQQTRQAYLGVTSGLAQIQALRQAVGSTRLQLESTKLGQEVGVRTAVDVLNAEQQLSVAERNLAQAVYSTIVNQLKLKAAVGKLAEADLADVNSLLKEDTQ